MRLGLKYLGAETVLASILQKLLLLETLLAALYWCYLLLLKLWS
jgi:hypothetical protein